MRHSNLTLAALFTFALLLAPGPAALAQNKHTLPLFISSSHQTLQGFVRIINRSDSAGTVTIHAIDDAGERFGPVTLSLGAGETQHFNSDSLRDGDPDKGLSGGIADGEGNWRLELETALDIVPLVYTRPKGEGFITSTHDVAGNESMVWKVPIFNPGSNTDQQSWLRVINVSGLDTEVEIEGLDDEGEPGAQTLRFDLTADEAVLLNAQELEAGSAECGVRGPARQRGGQVAALRLRRSPDPGDEPAAGAERESHESLVGDERTGHPGQLRSRQAIRRQRRRRAQSCRHWTRTTRRRLWLGR